MSGVSWLLRMTIWIVGWRLFEHCAHPVATRWGQKLADKITKKGEN